MDGGEFRPPPSANVAFHDVLARAVDFSDGEYLCFSGRSSRFEGCKFDRIRVENGPLGLYPRSLFRDCSFRDAEFRIGASPHLARFERCSFDGATIQEWFTHCAEFVDCSFAGARIIGSRFFGTPIECYGWLEFRRRKRNEFAGNDFSEAELIDTTFSAGIDLDAQRLPTGPGYLRINDAQQRIAEARTRIASWDGEAKRRGTTLLNALERESRDLSQPDLFIRKDTYEMAPELAEKLWKLLATPPGDQIGG